MIERKVGRMQRLLRAGLGVRQILADADAGLDGGASVGKGLPCSGQDPVPDAFQIRFAGIGHRDHELITPHPSDKVAAAGIGNQQTGNMR